MSSTTPDYSLELLLALLRDQQHIKQPEIDGYELRRNAGDISSEHWYDPECGNLRGYD